MRQARSNFHFFHDYHDHRQGAKACPRHDNKVLTLNLFLGFTVAFHSLHDGNDDSLIRAHLIFYSSPRLVPLLLSDEVWSQAGGERASGATGHFSGAAIFFPILIFFIYNFFNFKI